MACGRKHLERVDAAHSSTACCRALQKTASRHCWISCKWGWGGGLSKRERDGDDRKDCQESSKERFVRSFAGEGGSVGEREERSSIGWL
mmetsp:Transcript_14945/g.23795  ORF Transcript_14945/g.23795 Transcript_14945/m.23795 type:complete len:89 (-) Transcript_14945:69-335(-)